MFSLIQPVRTKLFDCWQQRAFESKNELVKGYAYPPYPIPDNSISRLAYRHTSPQDAPKRRPGTTSGAPGESHNYVAVLFPLNQSCVAVAAWDGLGCAAAPMLSIVVPTILPADVKATSRAHFSHP